LLPRYDQKFVKIGVVMAAKKKQNLKQGSKIMVIEPNFINLQNDCGMFLVS
jgi:hypothetical protein